MVIKVNVNIRLRENQNGVAISSPGCWSLPFHEAFLLCLCTEVFQVEPDPNTGLDQENAKTRDERITRCEPMRPAASQRNHKQDSPIQTLSL